MADIYVVLLNSCMYASLIFSHLFITKFMYVG